MAWWDHEDLKDKSGAMTVGKIEFGPGYTPPMRAAYDEIASRIAAAQRSKDADDGGYWSDDKTYECAPIPTSEWSPTIGQPEAAKFAPKWDYETLWDILADAYDHAATGKGKERHARDLPFDKQPMLETTRLVGPGFPLGQAIKKAGEAAGMIERSEYDAAESECLGAINYLAGAVAWMREKKAAIRGKIVEAA